MFILPFGRRVGQKQQVQWTWFTLLLRVWSWASSTDITWELIREAEAQAHPDVLNLNLRFNRTPKQLVHTNIWKALASGVPSIEAHT